MLHINISTGSRFYRSGVMAGHSFTFYTAGLVIFDFFCSCNLDLDTMTFTYCTPWRYVVPDVHI